MNVLALYSSKTPYAMEKGRFFFFASFCKELNLHVIIGQNPVSILVLTLE